jgi:hypothetical protein
MDTPANNCVCNNCSVDACGNNDHPTNRGYSAPPYTAPDGSWRFGEACVNRDSLNCKLGTVYPTNLPVNQADCATETPSIQPTHANLVMVPDNQVQLNQPYDYARNFASEKCGEDGICKGTVYAQPFDPRLYDNRRGQINPLDRPPYTGKVLLKDVYSPELNRYGKDYNSYSDITAGQIQYYYSKDIAGAYSLPNFTQRSEVNREIFKDPMGAIKPVYTRCPIKPKAMSTGCLQDIRDSTIHRESIMEGLTAKMNQRRWASRYGNSGCQ